MQLDPQTFLDMAEATSKIACVDIEATGLKGDYNSIMVISVKPFNKKPVSFHVAKPGNDEKLVYEAGEYIESFTAWVTYYGKGFDIPMINTRRLRWGLPPLVKRHHIDMYYSLKSNILTARRSQAHLLEWLDTPEKKMTVGAEEWNKVLADPDAHMGTMVKRCESDTKGLEGLYTATRHLIREIKL